MKRRFPHLPSELKNILVQMGYSDSSANYLTSQYLTGGKLGTEKRTRRDVLKAVSIIRRMKTNPPSRHKIKAMRLAHRMAYRIWKHVRHQGYAIPVPKRTPAIVKKYVQMILKANGVDWTLKNPLDRKEYKLVDRELLHAKRLKRRALKRQDFRESEYWAGKIYAYNDVVSRFGRELRRIRGRHLHG